MRTPIARPAAGLAITLGVIGSGCSVPGTSPRPAPISHIAFVTLADESERGQLLADSDAMLGTIPSVSSYAAGFHMDTGRASVNSDYTLGIYLGFETSEDLHAYVVHPQHVAYVEKWKPRITTLLVRDVLDESP